MFISYCFNNGNDIKRRVEKRLEQVIAFDYLLLGHFLCCYVPGSHYYAILKFDDRLVKPLEPELLERIALLVSLVNACFSNLRHAAKDTGLNNAGILLKQAFADHVAILGNSISVIGKPNEINDISFFISYRPKNLYDIECA